MSTTSTRGYAIKPGYAENPCPVYFSDDVTTSRGIVFQPDVYTFAEMVARLAGLDLIVDIGCGWADKLHAMHLRNPHWRFVGVDHGTNIDVCRDRYKFATWVEHDLETPLTLDVAFGAAVICSDVIEHLADPSALLASLKASRAAVIVVSTPERDVLYGDDHMGPPPNLCHIREWNRVEFRELLEGAGLTVDFHGLTRGDDVTSSMTTQMVVCRP